MKVNKLSNEEDIWKLVDLKRDNYIKFSHQIFKFLFFKIGIYFIIKYKPNYYLRS